MDSDTLRFDVFFHRGQIRHRLLFRFFGRMISIYPHADADHHHCSGCETDRSGQPGLFFWVITGFRNIQPWLKCSVVR